MSNYATAFDVVFILELVASGPIRYWLTYVGPEADILCTYLQI
jgi:hypothetical protein